MTHLTILAARKYKSPRQGPLDATSKATRRIAYAIKNPNAPMRDFYTAACEMAALIKTPCWLVPIPSSKGSTRANTILAHLIAFHRPSAQLAPAIRRSQPIDSQCCRHRRNLPALKPKDHHITALRKSLGNRQLYFVDNVATSGNTLRAAYNALKCGTGLVFADAGRHMKF